MMSPAEIRNLLVVDGDVCHFYPVRNNAPLLCSGDENYSFFSGYGIQSPV